MDLFQEGTFHLHSGAFSRWKIECDALSEGEWDTLGLMLSEILPPFSEVVGVPRGGIKLAQAMQEFRTPGGFLLIVDDVLTTGNSMREERAFRETRHGLYPQDIQGAVIFARGACPIWVTPLFQMYPLGTAKGS